MADAPGQLEISLHVPLADPLPGGKPSRVSPTSETLRNIQELGWVLRGQPTPSPPPRGTRASGIDIQLGTR